MSIVLHHHPYSRAATAVWMLEEVGVPYELPLRANVAETLDRQQFTEFL
jgi:hypothetical protein